MNHKEENLSGASFSEFRQHHKAGSTGPFRHCETNACCRSVPGVDDASDDLMMMMMVMMMMMMMMVMMMMMMMMMMIMIMMMIVVV